LALQIFEQNLQLGIRKIIRLYKILHSTLSHRINGRSIYIDTMSNLRKLTVLEEEVVVREILDLDSRGFLPWIYNIEDIANRLLTIYDTIYIGPH